MPRVAAAPPDLRQQHGRLRWAREEAGFPSARAAAVKFGWNENTYKSHEQGIRGADGLKTSHIKRYARAFRVNEAWLATGAGTALKTPDPLEEMSQEDRELALRLLNAAKRA